MCQMKNKMKCILSHRSINVNKCAATVRYDEIKKTLYDRLKFLIYSNLF